MTIWALSGESVALPHLTVTPERSSRVMWSRLGRGEQPDLAAQLVGQRARDRADVAQHRLVGRVRLGLHGIARGRRHPVEGDARRVDQEEVARPAGPRAPPRAR